MIKLLVIDVDGTLTNGSIIYGNGGAELKSFSVKDGLILKILPELGIKTIILTARESESVYQRGKELGINVIPSVSNKESELIKIINKHKITFEQTAYIGDDLNDYAAMKQCGFKSCPVDAVSAIKAICDYISPLGGGFGAVRDICEELLKRENKIDIFLNRFGVNN